MVPAIAERLQQPYGAAVLHAPVHAHRRIGGGEDLITVLNLGRQALTGVFPKSPDDYVTTGPLELVWSPKSGLLQLAHSYNADEMYGENCGYRSGLNQSMVDHLTRKVGFLEGRANLSAGDTVLDIGSNDCTTLKAYRTPSLKRVGIDPTGEKFCACYPPRYCDGSGLLFGGLLSRQIKRAREDRDLHRDVLRSG